MRWPLLLAVLATAAVSAQAQPASERVSSSSADLLELPPLDNAALERRADAARRVGPAPLRFAEPVEVALDAKLRTGWTTADDGTRVWRLVVSSPGAYSLSFGFDRFRLPPDASLWIYPEGQEPEYRAFTAADNEAHGELWTPIVPGDRAVIELNLPPAKLSDLEDYDLELTQVNHAFLPAMLTAQEKSAAGAQQSGSCNVDFVCPPGDDYRAVGRSVGAYTVQGVDFCTGAAVNNTARDGRPLFLTADHCGVTPGNQAAVVVYWNYQSPSCRAPGSEESGASGVGARSQFNSGAVELGDGPTSDWSVLELDDAILPEAYVYLAGWDRRDIAPSSVVAIHHPGVEEKRISIEDDATTITTYSSDTPTSSGTHIRVDDWDLGTTEGGSSGSPLFNADNLIVGQLHGGAAACGNDAPDWYGRMYRSMNDGLDSILDPDGTGAETLEGVGVPFTSASISASRVSLGETARLTFVVGNPTNSPLNGVTFSHAIPPGIDYMGNLSSSLGSATESGGEVAWSGDLAVGAELVIEFDVAVDRDAGYGLYTYSGAATLGASGAVLRDEVSQLVLTPRPDPTVSVESVATVSIPDAQCDSGFLTSTLDVTEQFEVARVSLGLNVTHSWRGDLRARLTSPSGTTVTLLNRPGGVNNASDNLDVLFDDAADRGTLADRDHSTGEPYYEFEIAPEAGLEPLATMVGEPSNGVWTLGICDGAGQDVGTLNRWSLYLVDASAGESTSTPDNPSSRADLVQIVGANPFEVSTDARIEVAGVQRVRAVLIDATGRVVRTVLEGDVAGSRTVSIQRSTLSAGSYFLYVETEGQSQTVPLTVLR